MSRIVPERERTSEVHSLDRKMLKASMHQRPEGRALGTAVIDVVMDSLHAIKMSDKEACIWMEFDQSQFSRCKRGESRLPFDAVWKLPDHFWAEFVKRMNMAKGLTVSEIRELKAVKVGELVVRLLVEAS